jgi:hypothetical protein
VQSDRVALAHPGWRGSASDGAVGAAVMDDATAAAADAAAAARAQVRKTRQVGPEVGPTSAFYSCTPIGKRGPTCVFWANLTPFSLPQGRAFKVAIIGGGASGLVAAIKLKQAGIAMDVNSDTTLYIPLVILYIQDIQGGARMTLTSMPRPASTSWSWSATPASAASGGKTRTRTRAATCRAGRKT